MKNPTKIDQLLKKYQKKLKEEDEDLDILSDMAFCNELPRANIRKSLYKTFIKELKNLKDKNG